MSSGRALAATLAVVAVVGPCLLPSVAADGGLTVLVFPQVHGATGGETVPFIVEVYRWGAPFDPANLTFGVAMGSGLEIINTTHESVGRWTANFTLNATWGDGASAWFYAWAETAEGQFAFEDFRYLVGPRELPWEVRMRIVAEGSSSPRPGPGDAVVLEVRTYEGGLLSGGKDPAVNLSTFEGGVSAGQWLNGTAVSAGVWRFSFDVPGDLRATRRYSAIATIPGARSSYPQALEVIAQPFGFAISANVTSDSVLAHVWMWDEDGPAEGAGVRLVPMASGVDAPSSYADREGHAVAFATFGPAPPTRSFVLTVRMVHGDRTAEEVMRVQPAGAPGGGASGGFLEVEYSCDAELPLDPTTFHRGDLVLVPFQVEFAGGAPAETNISVFWWRSGDSAAQVQERVVVAPGGTFVFEYRIPEDWRLDDYLNLRFVCPDGQTLAYGSTFAEFPRLPGGDVALTAADAPGEIIEVTATRLPSSGTAFGPGWVGLAPSADPAAGRRGALAGTLMCGFGEPSGNSSTCAVVLPAGLPDGPYVAFGYTSTVGFEANLSREGSFSNATTVTWAREAKPSGGPPQGTPNDPFPWVEATATAIAALAVVGGLVAIRRRRGI